MIYLRIVIGILLVTGCFFTFSGVLGVLRMPDIYCRIQARTNITTLGTLCILLGISMYGFFIEDSISIGVKSIIIGLFILITNPVSSHAVTRASKRIGIGMVEKSVCDEYGRDNLK